MISPTLTLVEAAAAPVGFGGAQPPACNVDAVRLGRGARAASLLWRCGTLRSTEPGAAHSTDSTVATS